MAMEITVQKTDNPKEKPDQGNLGFGTNFTDHMFIMDYSKDKGWHDARIIPYGPMKFDPAMATLHYGQAVFEGMKAYKSLDNRILLFRPEKNMERLNNTNDRMCIPRIDEEFCLEAIKKLVNIDKEWIPTAPGTSLYIRPFIIATDKYLGLKPSSTYKFMVILSPVGAYYPQGVNPVEIYVENEYVRAVPGGTGHVKTSGNYAASLKAQAEASTRGYVQVLWLDGLERKYIEEVGSMNVFFKIDGELVTPALVGSILPGVTRDSTIELVKSWGIKVTERRISIAEIFEEHKKGRLEEAFGTGTAAVISPIGELNWEGRSIKVNDGKTGRLAERVYQKLTGIQTGELEDDFGWTEKI